MFKLNQVQSVPKKCLNNLLQHKTTGHFYWDTVSQTPSVIYSSEVHISFGGKNQTFIYYASHDNLLHHHQRLWCANLSRERGQERSPHWAREEGRQLYRQGGCGGGGVWWWSTMEFAGGYSWGQLLSTGDHEFSHTVSLVIFTSYLYFVMI